MEHDYNIHLKAVIWQTQIRFLILLVKYPKARPMVMEKRAKQAGVLVGKSMILIKYIGRDENKIKFREVEFTRNAKLK